MSCLSMSQLHKANRRAELDCGRGQGIMALHMAELHTNTEGAGAGETCGFEAVKNA